VVLDRSGSENANPFVDSQAEESRFTDVPADWSLTFVVAVLEVLAAWKAAAAMYRVAQKISHYQESSLNRIKNRQYGY